MKTLVSTFGPGDAELVIKAMRELPYDRLVLIGEPGVRESSGFDTLSHLEDVCGHKVEAEEFEVGDFLSLVDDISDVLEKHARESRNSISLNVSGGSKLLGNAAILAAFRLGVETYHCDSKVVKLPILKGASPKDRFTGHQIQMIKAVGDCAISLDELVNKMKPSSKQAAERVLRELKNHGILQSSVETGKVTLSLSKTGLEVLRAVQSAER